MFSSFAFRITICALMVVDLAVAHPLPLFIKESPIITASALHVTYLEFAFICVFLTGERSSALSRN